MLINLKQKQNKTKQKPHPNWEKKAKNLFGKVLPIKRRNSSSTLKNTSRKQYPCNNLNSISSFNSVTDTVKWHSYSAHGRLMEARNGQANAGSWLDTKNALYYCIQSANSFSWVLYPSWHAPSSTRLNGLFFSLLVKQNFEFLVFWFKKLPIISQIFD